ncbi:MFS transporter [Vreelandella titanicae]|jgi:MFS family permease|uniref:Major facilitator superfamily, general substrate transporter n=1 Tax=Vreelandella titanicae BH1 TaxID=1204738 RepID=L9U8I6_9GAMM|nr:MFS transporter [Halomonas titanicae]ELY21159.1 Major facilitator superfamily, general substrate transporter [Halomonas titanicae BH1]NVE90566.1 MFS transporter [Halomonas titanicae]
MRLLILLVSTSTFFNLYQLQAIYPWLSIRYGAGLTEAGWLNMATLLGMMITAPFASKITRKILPQHAIIAGVLTLALLNIIIAISKGLELLFIVRFLQGITLPCILTSGIQILSKIEDINSRKKCVGYYVAGTIFGSTLSRFYPAISIDLLGWQIGFISCSGFLLLACYFIAQRAQSANIKSIEKEQEKAPYISYLKVAFLEKRLLIAYVLGFGLLLSQSSIFTVLGLSLAEFPYNKSSSKIGLIYLASLPAIVVTLLIPKLFCLKREKFFYVTFISLLWASLSLMGSNFNFIIIGVIGFSISTYSMQIMTTEMVSRAQEVPANFASGIYLFFYYGGGTIGAFFSAFSYNHWGWLGALIFVAIFQTVILVIVIFLVIDSRKEARQNVKYIE